MNEVTTGLNYPAQRDAVYAELRRRPMLRQGSDPQGGDALASPAPKVELDGLFVVKD